MKLINWIRDIQAAKLQEKVSHTYGLQIINLNELSRYNQKTFFILGSGDTINDLTPQQWEAIDKGFSVGMNKWLLHDFIPDATSLEKDWHKDFYEHLYQADRLLSSKFKFLFYPSGNVNNYNGFPFNFDSRIINKIRIHGGARMISSNRFELDSFHNSVNFLSNVRNKLEKQGLNYEQKGSVYWLIQFALAAGFKHIVFCGIDLNNTKYFWEDQKFKSRLKISQSEINVQKGKIHATDIKQKNALPISEIIDSISIALQGKVLFQTSSNKSKLVDIIDVWRI